MGKDLKSNACGAVIGARLKYSFYQSCNIHDLTSVVVGPRIFSYGDLVFLDSLVLFHLPAIDQGEPLCLSVRARLLFCHPRSPKELKWHKGMPR